jgi:hypothetical protein
VVRLDTELRRLWGLLIWQDNLDYGLVAATVLQMAAKECLQDINGYLKALASQLGWRASVFQVRSSLSNCGALGHPKVKAPSPNSDVTWLTTGTY